MLRGQRELGEGGFQINVLFKGSLLWHPSLYIGMGKFFIRLGDACICSCRLADADGVVSTHVLEPCGRPAAALAGGAQGMQPLREPRGEFWGAAEKAIPRGFAVGSRAGSQPLKEMTFLSVDARVTALQLKTWH